MLPQYKEDYSLLLGSSHFYIVFKMVATIYERLVMAKRLISAKNEKDLAQESVKETLAQLMG